MLTKTSNSNHLKKYIKKSIPGYISYLDSMVLHHLVKPYNNEHCIGVELGSLHGKSSFTLATTIDQGKLYCIDPWEDFDTYDERYSPFVNQIENLPKPGMKNSLDFFLENTKVCNNIIPLKGRSPDLCKEWSTPIDFIFIDAEHTNPSDRINIDFWLPKIKPGGKLIGHDYYIDKKFPDINDNIRYLEKLLSKKFKNVTNSSVWWFNI
jgi:predicted O-methyltransferase YrrM